MEYFNGQRVLGARAAVGDLIMRLGGRRSSLRQLLWAAMCGALASAGCLHHLHPVPEEAKLQVCRGSRAHQHSVHVFLVHGFDPLDYANLQGVRDYLQEVGFVDTRLHQYFDCRSLAVAVREAKRGPEDRIALVGFSLGCAAARRVANELHEEDQLDVDLLFYMGGWFLPNDERSRPPFVPRVVHALGSGCDEAGGPMPGADNIKLASRHFGSPTDPALLRRLADELALLTQDGARQAHPSLGPPRCR